MAYTSADSIDGGLQGYGEYTLAQVDTFDALGSSRQKCHPTSMLTAVSGSLHQQIAEEVWPACTDLKGTMLTATQQDCVPDNSRVAEAILPDMELTATSASGAAAIAKPCADEKCEPRADKEKRTKRRKASSLITLAWKANQQHQTMVPQHLPQQADPRMVRANAKWKKEGFSQNAEKKCLNCGCEVMRQFTFCRFCGNNSFNP